MTTEVEVVIGESQERIIQENTIKVVEGQMEVFDPILLYDSPNAVLGTEYVSLDELTFPVTKVDLLPELLKAQKGTWVKVFEKGMLQGEKVEVHFFRNQETGSVFNVKVKKFGKWPNFKK